MALLKNHWLFCTFPWWRPEWQGRCVLWCVQASTPSFTTSTTHTHKTSENFTYRFVLGLLQFQSNLKNSKVTMLAFKRNEKLIFYFSWGTKKLVMLGISCHAWCRGSTLVEIWVNLSLWLCPFIHPHTAKTILKDQLLASNLTEWLLHAVSGSIELVSIYYEVSLHTEITIHHPPHNSIQLHWAWSKEPAQTLAC